MNQRLRDEHARALARALVEIIRPCLREEEIGEAFNEFLSLCQGGLQDYARAVLLMRKRLRPFEANHEAAAGEDA